MAHSLTANIGREQRAEPVSPEAHRFVANIDAALEQEILDVAQRSAPNVLTTDIVERIVKLLEMEAKLEN